MREPIPKISFVFPVYNEEAVLGALYEEVKKECLKAGVDYEMIFVDDASTDNSLALIKEMKNKDPGVEYLSLSRNFSHQNAIFAGMSYAKGNAVITMDADMQHPPSLVPEMIKAWREGHEVVYTTKRSVHRNFIDFLFFKAFYWVMSKVSGLNLKFGQSDFRLLDKKALKALLDIPEYHKFLRGQVEWIGFRQKALSYDADKRYGGKSKFSYGKRLSFAMDGIFAFSRYPLHLVSLFSVFIAFLSFGYMLYAILAWILSRLNIYGLYIASGETTIVVAIFFLGSVQLISIGILGEYICRTYDQGKGRPVFIVRENSIDGQNG